MRVPTKIGPAKGFLYDCESEPLFEKCVEGMEDCTCPEELGAELVFDHKVRRGYRLGDRLIKYYGAGHSRDLLRPAPALRAANTYEELLPIRSPKPELAVEIRNGLKLQRSLIVCEFVEGPILGDAWGSVPEAEATLGPFLAKMHDSNIYHGVMKFDHLIWNRGDWVVIDTESLRHSLRKLRPRALAERQWASLAMDLGASESLRAAFESYVEARGLRWNRAATWEKILDRSQAIIAGKARR